MTLTLAGAGHQQRFSARTRADHHVAAFATGLLALTVFAFPFLTVTFLAAGFLTELHQPHHAFFAAFALLAHELAKLLQTAAELFFLLLAHLFLAHPIDVLSGLFEILR